MASQPVTTGAPTCAPSIQRRSLLTALAAAPAVALPAAAALPGSDPDAAIMDAWGRRARALAAIEKRGDYYDCEEHSPEEVLAFDEAEGDIGAADARTPRGVLVKLWLALHAGTSAYSDHGALVLPLMRRADLEGLRPHHRPLDWEGVLLFQAIDSLSRIAGRV